MALAIKAIPTLYGETAEAFEREVERVESAPGTLDYTREAKVVRDYLRNINLL